MINSPDLQHLLVKSWYDDKYIVKYGGSLGGLAGQSGGDFVAPGSRRLLPQSPAGEASLPRNIAELCAFNENIYDIKGHRVMTLGGGIILIDIDGVAFDQLECVTGKRLPTRGSLGGKVK